MDREPEENAISAFFASKIKIEYPWLTIIEHEYDPIHDTCFITIDAIRDTIDIGVWINSIQRHTGVVNVKTHTRKRGSGFIIELDKGCRHIFLGSVGV